MSGRRRTQSSIRKKKRIFITEMVVLCLLSIVLFLVLWMTGKLSLIKHVQLDTNKIKISEKYTNIAGAGANAMEGIDVFALVGIDARDAVDGAKNSDTMIICVLDHNNKKIKLCSIYRDTYLNIGDNYYGEPDSYQKANAAYNLGGPEQFLSMVNLNLDLNITEYITVDFVALAQTVDLLGGIDIDMTREELGHVNNYNVETSEACGVEYQKLEEPDDPNFDGVITHTFHCTGSQAVSYARVRYTSGNDFRRASRQRKLLALIKEKASQADIGTLDSILNAVLPKVSTNIDNVKMLKEIGSVVSYSMEYDDQIGFPFVHAENMEEIVGDDVVAPVTLAYNVKVLHNALFGDTEYEPSQTVQDYSDHIVSQTGLGDNSIEEYAAIADGHALPGISKENYDKAVAQGMG